jgi:hypothetical protein
MREGGRAVTSMFWSFNIVWIWMKKIFLHLVCVARFSFSDVLDLEVPLLVVRWFFIWFMRASHHEISFFVASFCSRLSSMFYGAGVAWPSLGAGFPGAIWFSQCRLLPPVRFGFPLVASLDLVITPILFTAPTQALSPVLVSRRPALARHQKVSVFLRINLLEIEGLVLQPDLRSDSSSFLFSACTACLTCCGATPLPDNFRL